jgi:nucleoside-diphosphate-sugar epimerase
LEIILTIKEKSLFCFGTGYSAQVIARALLSKNEPNKWRIYGSYREEKQAGVLLSLGIEPIKFQDSKLIIKNVDAILSSVPPNEDGDPVITHYGALLSEVSNNTWIGYFSTTGVYGDTKGILVDETAHLNPSNNRSIRRVDAEKNWLNYAAHIFRLPGIYGPGRSTLERLKRGITRSIYYPGHLFSRIHVEDIAQTVIASINQPNPGSIYNICDDEAAEPRVVELFGSKLLGIEPPKLTPFKEAFGDMSAMAKTFWQDSRRIKNTKIKHELGVKLLYPNYRQGLKAIHEDSKNLN